MIMSVSNMQERCKQRKTPTNVSVFLCLRLVTRTGIELSLGLLLIYGEVRQTAVLCGFSAISF